MPLVRVIVTADDFGLSKMVDRGILEAAKRGVVNNTALLVNFPDFEQSAERLRGVEGLEVGMHLNLTAGPSVLSPKQVPTLVDRRGVFPGLARFFLRASCGLVDWTEASREWEAQIERGLQCGFRFTSLTSHQHIHMLPELARITAALAHKFAIPAVRLSRFHANSMLRPLRLKAFALAPFARAARKLFAERRVVCNDFVIDVPALEASAAVRRLCEVIEGLPAGAYELVSHPGYVDDTLRSRDALTDGRLIDMNVLTAGEIQSLWNREGFALTTFGALAAARTAASQDASSCR